MSESRAFWRGRKVLITGHTGFKGSWLCLWLEWLGAEVHGLALDPPSTPSLFEEAQVASTMHSTIADVRDTAAVSSVIRGCEPELVIHMAAQTLVRRSYREPLDTLATNILGTAHMLEAVRHAPSVRAVVVVTSDKCYENRERQTGYHEDDPLGGHDPYSASKACAEIVTAAYRRSFLSPESGREPAVAVATVRAGNVIGGGDWSRDRLIPDIVRAFASGQPAVIRNPQSTRPWQHVLDPLAGYLLVAERLLTDPEGIDTAWNFGPREVGARPVEWIAARLCTHWGDGATWVRAADGGPHEATLLHLDSARARSRLGWSPLLDVDAALGLVAAWYRGHLEGVDARTLTLAEIESYEEQRVTVQVPS